MQRQHWYLDVRGSAGVLSTCHVMGEFNGLLFEWFRTAASIFVQNCNVIFEKIVHWPRTVALIYAGNCWFIFNVMILIFDENLLGYFRQDGLSVAPHGCNDFRRE